MSIENQLLFLLSKTDEVDGKELIALFVEAGFTAQAIRNSLSKLKKERFITSSARSVYTITQRGTAAIEPVYFKKNYYYENWDGKWFVVFVEIPETERKKRDYLRRSLKQLGFGMLYKGVYLYPWDITDDVINLVDSLEIEEYATIAAVDRFILNTIRNAGAKGPNEAARIWDLDYINSQYIEKYSWFATEIEPFIQTLSASAAIGPLEPFLCYLKILEAKNELLAIDPMLPPQFLPSEWMGAKAIASFEKAMSTLAGMIPDKSYYSRFVR